MDFDKKYFAAASILLIAAVGIGFAVLSASDEAESPQTTYGYLPVSADSGLFDLPALMVAGPSYGNDNPDKYRCWDDSFYVDEDGDRAVEYFDGSNSDLSPGEYYTGYEKSYADAEICGGRYNYQCDFSSGCDGFVEDDSSDDDSGSDDTGDSGSDDSSSSTNKAPEIESIDTPATVNTSETFTVSVEASDPDDPSLSYSWSNGETGQSISLNYGEPGVKELDVEVSDGDKSTSSTVRVNVVEQEEDAEEPVTDPKPANPVVQLWNWFTGLFS